jgi:hypothetical protein
VVEESGVPGENHREKLMHLTHGYIVAHFPRLIQSTQTHQ